jgi:hypothetical protein
MDSNIRRLHAGAILVEKISECDRIDNLGGAAGGNVFGGVLPKQNPNYPAREGTARVV